MPEDSVTPSPAAPPGCGSGTGHWAQNPPDVHLLTFLRHLSATPQLTNIYVYIFLFRTRSSRGPAQKRHCPTSAGPGALPALPRSGAAAPGAPAAPAAPSPRRRALNFPGAEAASALQCLAVNKRQAVTTQPSCSQSGGCLCTFPLQHTPSAF